MDNRQKDELREKVPCAALLEKAGWQVDLKESTARAVKYRRGEGEIVIVIHGGRGWFDPMSTSKGDVFDLAKHLGAKSFPEALDHVAALVGFQPTRPAWKRPARAKPLAPVMNRWNARIKPRPGSPTWRYLAEVRAVPDHLIKEAVAQDCLREGPHGSMWAAHTNDAGVVTGWEERGPDWRGFANAGSKRLFRFGTHQPSRVCITEAAIDALSVAAFEGLRHDTLYASTGGGWAPATEDDLKALAARPNIQLVAATDSNIQGDVFGDRIRAITTQAGCGFGRLRSRFDDWNADLQDAIRRAR
ncbi:MAG: DUF3991 domain-containing protein [Pseudomonadota bacterium]